MALTGNERLILILVLLALMTFIVFFELRVMRRKSKEVRVASQKKDEAFNAVLTTRSVLNTVRNRGGDVGGAPALLDRAKYSMNKGDYDSCIDLCEKARTEITNPSSGRVQPSDQPDSDAKKRLEEVAEAIVSVRQARGEQESYKGTKLEGPNQGNYLGAKFEISSAKADVGRAAKSGGETSSAESLIVQAETAFTAGDYDKALSLAVRSRKALNSSSRGETIALRNEEEEEPSAEPEVYEVGMETSKAPSTSLCKECGAVLEKGDAFCPICGAKVRPNSCPSCGAKPRPNDKFCRKCGAKFG